MARETSTRGCVDVGVAERVRCFVQIMLHARVTLLLIVLCHTSKPLRGIYFWWNYAKGIVKISEEGRRLTSIYDTSDINAPVHINVMYTRRALTFFH